MSRIPSRLGHQYRGLALATSLAVALANITPVFAQDGAADPPVIGPFGDITTYRVDHDRTAVHPGSVPLTTPGLVWSTKLATEAHFNPLIANGTLYVGDFDGILHALDPATGGELWSYDAGDVIENSATIEDGVIAFEDASGRVHVLDAANGDVLWTRDGFAGGYEMVDGVLYVSSENGLFSGLDATTGDEVWSEQLPATVRSLTISDGVAYVGSTAGEVFAVSLADGTQLWPPIHLLSNRPSSMPIVEGILYTSSSQPPGAPAGELLAVDAASGKVLWRFRSPAGTQVGPGAVHDGTLYVASQDNGLYAFDAVTGEIRWHVDAPRSWTPANLAGQAVLVTGAEGDLTAFDASDGHELWRVTAGVGSNVGPAVSGGLIFQVDDRGTLFAFGDQALPQIGEVPVADLAGDVIEAVASDDFVHVATWDASMIEGLDQPSGADMGPDGLYYVVSASSNEIIVLGPDGVVVRRWGEPGTGEGQFGFARTPGDPFSDIGGVAVAPDGTVYVAESANRRVQSFTSDGAFIRQFGSFGSGEGQFLEPFDLDVGPDGSVYVVDDVRDDIQRFTADGTYLQTIGRHGTGDGELQYTSSIVVTDDGTLLNADWDNQRVQAWDADGEFLWTLGERGTELGQFLLPADVAVDEAGRLFVSDFDNGRVQAFSATGDPLGQWLVPPDDLSLSGAITAAGGGRLYLNNSFGDRIHVLEYVGA